MHRQPSTNSTLGAMDMLASVYRDDIATCVLSAIRQRTYGPDVNIWLRSWYGDGPCSTLGNTGGETRSLPLDIAIKTQQQWSYHCPHSPFGGQADTANRRRRLETPSATIGASFGPPANSFLSQDHPKAQFMLGPLHPSPELKSDRASRRREITSDSVSDYISSGNSITRIRATLTRCPDALEQKELQSDHQTLPKRGVKFGVAWPNVDNAKREE